VPLPLAAAPEPAAARAALVLAIGLAALAVARAIAAGVHGMGAWGLNALRFLPPVLGWPLWALATLALIPPLARPLEPWCSRIGDAMAAAPRRSMLAAAVLGALIVLMLPDRVRFVGDFLLRQGTVEESGRPGVLFPQALPLDVLLHVTLPTRLMEGGWLGANGAARAVGALEAALLGALAVALARVLGQRGAAALAVAMVAWWSGALTMFTGYSKAFAELSVLVVAGAVFALGALRTGKPPLALGVLLAVGLTLHRSALGFVPLVATTWFLWWRAHGAGALRRPAVWVALLVPLAALAAMLPKIVATFLRWDTVHLAPAEVKAQGGPLRAAFAGNRPADLASLMCVLAPLLPAVVPALVAMGRGVPRRREALLIAALVLPLVGVIPFIHPAQGLFRDWDDFASAGAALAVMCAWIAGEALRGAPRFAWLALAVSLAAAVPSLQWMVLQNDLSRGLRRVEAIVGEPPARTGAERGETWDYLGIRNFRLQRWDASAAAFARAAETSPSPRILMQWAVAETQKGDLAAAQRIYRQMVVRNPDDFNGWAGLASVSSQMSDAATSREAALQMLRLHPGDRDATALLESIEAVEPAPGGRTR
jgi:hypothetical protein